MFNVGDIIVGNEHNNYAITRIGRRCEVVEVSETGDCIRVRLCDNEFSTIYAVESYQFDLIERQEECSVSLLDYMFDTNCII